MDKYEQVARDIISDTKNTMFYLGSEYTKAINKTTNYLRSQFPEPQKIEGVRDLVSKITDTRGYDEAEKLITDFITAREADKWISVTEKLPVKDDKVLVIDEYNDICSSFFDGVNFTDTSYKITHWQVLPEVPKRLKSRLTNDR